MGKQKKTIWQRFLKWSELNLFKIAMFAVACGLSGAILLAAVNPASADPLEPLIRGVKVLWGADSYKWAWQKLPPNTEGAISAGGPLEYLSHPIQTLNSIGESISLRWQASHSAVIGYLLFELGRITGFIVFIRAMIKVLDESAVTLRTQRRAKRDIKHGREVTAIHGDSELAASLVRNLQKEGKRVLFSNADMVKYLEGDYTGKAHELGLALTAPKQVVAYDSDYKAIEFLEKNIESMMTSDAHVYVHLDEIAIEGMADEHISVFSMAEICAQLYWNEYPIYPKDAVDDFAASLSAPAPSKPKYRVVIVGEGDYAERLIEQALLSNIFDVAGGVRYDVIGDMRLWRMSHPGLDLAVSVNGDKLYFHEGAWYDNWGVIMAADRVILCGTAIENIRIAAEMQAEPIRELHVRNDYGASMVAYEKHKYSTVGPEKIVVFGTLKELCTSAIILQDRVHEHGRLRDIVYNLRGPRCNNCGFFDFKGITKVPDNWGLPEDELEKIRDQRVDVMYATGGDSEDKGITKCLNCQFFKKGWNEMYDLLRRSNYATAAHDGQKFRLLRRLGIPVSRRMDVRTELEEYMRLPQETRDALQEIEHIRWCRFYYLNGWTYGSEKDPHARTHYDLRPYKDLPQDTPKDADAYLNLCLMILTDEEERRWERIWLQ